MDISTKGDGNFDDINAGVGTTDANGNFCGQGDQRPAQLALHRRAQRDAGDRGFQLHRWPGSGSWTRRVTPRPRSPRRSRPSRATGAIDGFEIDTTPPKVTSHHPGDQHSVRPQRSTGQVLVTANLQQEHQAVDAQRNLDPGLPGRRLAASSTASASRSRSSPAAFKVTYLDTPDRSDSTSSSPSQAPLPNDLLPDRPQGDRSDADHRPRRQRPRRRRARVRRAATSWTARSRSSPPANSRLIYVSNAVGADHLPHRSAGKPGEPVPDHHRRSHRRQHQATTSWSCREPTRKTSSSSPWSACSRPTSRAPTPAFLPGSPLQTLIYGVPTTTTLGVVSTGTIDVIGVEHDQRPRSAHRDLRLLDHRPADRRTPVTRHDRHDVHRRRRAGPDANVLVDKNYIINAGIGVNVGHLRCRNAPTPQSSRSNVIAGNIAGVGDLRHQRLTISLLTPTLVINNTIVPTTPRGCTTSPRQPSTTQAFVLNNIFYEQPRPDQGHGNGTGINSLTAQSLIVGTNLFYQNGAAGKLPANNATGQQHLQLRSCVALGSYPDSYGNFSRTTRSSWLGPRPQAQRRHAADLLHQTATTT